ncbi:MAG TPA: TIGR03617 family F420-dependent LLM class oxidoreductase [Actinomycetota bacterium]|nr:TIGR03617 family F420-dependent LLM class oxidoreductase [Actinomycetota bacterium]
MDVGIALGGELDHLGAMAQKAEAAGYESVWVAETARSAYVQAALACQATTAVSIGTDIALAFPRSPTITAMVARDLAELSGGRFILGLGTQVKRINERRFSVPFEHPAPKIGEAVEAIRAVLGAYEGKPIDHRGRFYTLTMPPFPGAGPAPGPIPIYLAAVNTLMAKTAGRVADGVLGHPMTSPRYVREVLRPAVEEGAAEAGRPAEAVNITTGVIMQIADDADVARREAAAQVGFYATTRTYRPVLELHGFGDLVEPLRRAFVKGDVAEMVDIAAPTVDVLAIAGTTDECRDRLRSFDGAADRVILGGSWVGPGEGRIRENHLAILETFAPGA